MGGRMALTICDVNTNHCSTRPPFRCQKAAPGLPSFPMRLCPRFCCGPRGWWHSPLANTCICKCMEPISPLDVGGSPLGHPCSTRIRRRQLVRSRCHTWQITGWVGVVHSTIACPEAHNVIITVPRSDPLADPADLAALYICLRD